MQNFDLLDFLSHNYISLGTLANQNMWRSYCYGAPNIWWWHLREEANMPFGDTSYYFTENNRYRVSFWVVDHENSDYWNTFYLYIEDLKSSKVKVYVSTLRTYGSVEGERTMQILNPSIRFQNLNIEILDSDNNVLHTYSWNTGMTLLKGKQILHNDIMKSLLIFDKNEVLLYLYDSQNFREVQEIIIHFLAFSEHSTNISGIEYETGEVTNINESDRLYNGLNNTHIYINNLITYISNLNDGRVRLKISKDSVSKLFWGEIPDDKIVRPLSNDFPWFILFVFRPTPVSGNAPTNYNILLPIDQNYTGYHTPITRWKLNNGYRLSIDCGGVSTYIFIQSASIVTYNQNYLSIFVGHVALDINLNIDTFSYSGRIDLFSGNTRYRPPSITTYYYSCDIPISSLFYYYGDNTENLIWLFRYDSDPKLRTAYVVYTQNMSQYDEIIGNAYGIATIYYLGIYDQMYESNLEEDTYLTLNSYLEPNSYHTHLTQLFIFNTLAHTAPQVINGSWSYMHYLRFVLDDYTSSNLRIPIAIVEGDIRRDNIKHREISIDKMSTSRRYPIVQLSSLSKAHMPDVVLDGYIASLNADAGKNEDSAFGTLMPYYDLKEAKIQEPHPEWYFRIHIHAGTWYYIFKDLTSITSNNQMRTYRIQHNDGSLRIVLDVGLYFEIITETANPNNKKHTIIYADIFPSVYWCYGNESYEFLNVNVEWIQCRYSMPGSGMVRFRPNSNTIIGRPIDFGTL